MNGGGTHPIYRILKEQQPADLPSGMNAGFGEKGRIAWNYTSKLPTEAAHGILAISAQL